MRRQTGQPQYFPAITADKTTGLIAAMAILAALTGRAASGRGAIVEVPMFECMASFNLLEHLYGRQFVPPRGGTGYPRVLSPHRRPYRTLDGYICILPYTDAHWQAFFAHAGAVRHATDPRFITMAARTENIDLLYELAADLIALHTTDYWLDVCEANAIPASPVLSLDELIDDRHLDAVGLYTTLHDPALGDLLMPGVPVLFDGERPPVNVPPRLGEHNREILGKAGTEPGAGNI
jgi:crotonobetainyl-CoA:carnitine CoA-transferase CaiB-like acyl-CoA transferase